MIGANNHTQPTHSQINETMSTETRKQPHETIIPTIDESNPVELFQGATLKLTIDAAEREVEALFLDPSNPADYKHFGSFQRKLGSLGAAIDKAGKSIVDPIKAQAKEVDAMRKAAKERMTAIKAKFILPRVQFDEEVADHARRVNDSFELMHHGHKGVGEFGKATAQEWETIIANIEAIDMAEELFGDRLDEAKALKADSLDLNRRRLAEFVEAEAALEAGREALKDKQDAEAAERHKERETAKAKLVMDSVDTGSGAKETPPPAVTPLKTAKNAVYGQLLKRGMDKDKAILFVNDIAAGEIEYLKLEV